MTSPIKSNHENQIKLQIWSCRQGLVTVAFLWWEKLSQPQFYKDLTRKTIFSERCSSLGSSWMFGTGNRYGLEILLQFCRSVKIKSQKVLGTDSYVCRSYKGKTGMGAFLAIPFWIGLNVLCPIYSHASHVALVSCNFYVFRVIAIWVFFQPGLRLITMICNFC